VYYSDATNFKMMTSNAMQCAADRSSAKSYGKGACPDDEAHILCLPEEVWQNIALNMSAKDVLSLLCVNRRLCIGLEQTANLWKMLSNRDGTSCHEECTKTTQSPTQQKTCDNTNEEKLDWRAEKSSYLFRCHKTNPSKTGGGVHWYPVRPYGQFTGISDREGHISCVLSRHAISHQNLDPLISSMTGEERRHAKPQERIVVITGGFSNDDSVYLIHAGTGTSIDKTDLSGRRHHWDMKRVDPIGRGPSFVYGASLTTLPTLYSETVDGDLPRKLTATMRAIRFGGFRAGGYANETSQVVMLTVKQDANKVRKRQRRGKRDFERNDSNGSDEERWSTWEWHWNQSWEVRWSNITTTGIAPGDNDEENSFERDFLSRAYHTSTLLLDRYLVVIGGMKATGSIVNEAILDTKTWTWLGNDHIACGSDSMDSRPSDRHGHSVVLDDSRNRLVLFGGGSGSDLLRSGEDNSEVWELHLGQHWRDSEKFEESFPWKWKKLHGDSNVNNDDNNHNGSIVESVGDSTDSSASKLTPSQSLCLGRCHHGIKISRDTALFLFGSGRPSTNGLLAYDLNTDAFFRQQQLPHQSISSSSSFAIFSDFGSTRSAVHIKGILPKPRFTGIAAFLEEDGYIITHGGYCSQDHDTIGLIDVLDLAPGFRGRRSLESAFDGLAIDDRRVSYGAVTDLQAERGRRDPNTTLQRMLQTLMNTPAGERQAAAGVMLNEMRRDELPSNGQSLLLMTMIANGSPLLMGNEDEDEDLYAGMESD